MTSHEYLFKLGEVILEKESRQGYEALTPPERVFALVWWLEAEVNNGGFHQYFFNSAGDRAGEAAVALQLIKAERAAALLKRAMNVFGRSGPSKVRFERQDQLEALPDEGLEALEELDSAFYEYPDDLSSLLASFMQAWTGPRHEGAQPETRRSCEGR